MTFIISHINSRIYYGWIIVGASVLIGCFLFGIQSSYTVFFKSLEAAFSLNRFTTSSIFSTYMLLSSIFALLGGWTLDKYGPRIVVLIMGIAGGVSLLLTAQVSAAWQLFITYSVLFALSTGAMLPVIMTLVSRWFNRKRGLALGIASSGVNLGRSLIAPVAAYLIELQGWRMAYVTLGISAALVVIASSFLMKRDPSEIGSLPDGIKSCAAKIDTVHNTSEHNQNISLRNALKMNVYWLVALAAFGLAFCMMLVMTHVVPHATDSGISSIAAATVLTFMGVFSIVSRLLADKFSNVAGRKTAIASFALLFAISLLVLIWLKSLWMFYLFAVLFGLAWGGYDVLVLAIAADFFGGRNLGVIMGSISVGFSIGAAAGPALGGLLFDTTGSYTSAFLAAACVQGIIAVVLYTKLPSLKAAYASI